MHWKCWYAASLACVALIHGAQAAIEGPLSIVCEQEDVLNAGWKEPLNVTYSGGPQGEINLTSEHITLTLPASLTENSGVVDGVERSSTTVRGSDEVSAFMPTLQNLLDCALAAIQPEFKDDPDMLSVEISNCVPKTAIDGAPVAVNASVTIGLIPTQDANAPDVIVEIRRRYVDALTPAGNNIVIETYPGNCKVMVQ